MPFFEAIRLALNTIRVQKLKSFFTLVGVTIGVMFLIAVVSIVGGMSRYMQDDLVGKIIAVNSFNLRRSPDIQMGDITEEEIREWRRRPRIRQTDVPAVSGALASDVQWATESSDNLNVELPLVYAGINSDERKRRAKAALEKVQLDHRMDHRPNELSGGQRQRVAIARALVNEPAMLLADEPTGNLDSQTSEEIMRVFEGLASSGQTVVMVTHEPDIAAHARRVVVLRDGLISTDERREAFTSRLGL